MAPGPDTWPLDQKLDPWTKHMAPPQSETRTLEQTMSNTFSGVKLHLYVGQHVVDLIFFPEKLCWELLVKLGLT